MAQPLDWDYNHSYRSNPAARWLFDRVETNYGLEIVTDPRQTSPVRVSLPRGVIALKPDMEFPRLHWWVCRAVALTELGPDLIPDLIPVQRTDNVVPILRRPW